MAEWLDAAWLWGEEFLMWCQVLKPDTNAYPGFPFRFENLIAQA
jgi:hypothetical protein